MKGTTDAKAKSHSRDFGHDVRKPANTSCPSKTTNNTPWIIPTTLTAKPNPNMYLRGIATNTSSKYDTASISEIMRSGDRIKGISAHGGTQVWSEPTEIRSIGSSR